MKNNNKGFTLAEMLIVVAIIAVLIAIAIPTFVGQLEKARETADASNIRAAYSEAVSKHLMETPDEDTVTIEDVRLSSSGSFEHVDLGKFSFSMPASFSVTAGLYDITFDFSEATPSATFASAGD